MLYALHHYYIIELYYTIAGLLYYYTIKKYNTPSLPPLHSYYLPISLPPSLPSIILYFFFVQLVIGEYHK